VRNLALIALGALAATPTVSGCSALVQEPKPADHRTTGRIVPTVPIHVEVIAGDGRVVDEKALNFYYAEFFHYANNFEVPDSGAYRIRATLSAPTFKRHGDAEEGPALAKGATVTFDDVTLGAQ
jgi:Fe2+ transport protein